MTPLIYFDIAAAICMAFLFALVATLIMLILILIASDIIGSMRQRKKQEAYDDLRYTYREQIRIKPPQITFYEINKPLITTEESTSEKE